MYAGAATRRLASKWRSQSGGGGLQASLRNYQMDQEDEKKRADTEMARRRLAPRTRPVSINTKDPCYRVAVVLLLPALIIIIIGAVMSLCSHSKPIGVGTHFWESPNRSLYRWVGPLVLLAGCATMFFNYMMYKRAQIGPGSLRERMQARREQLAPILAKTKNRKPDKPPPTVEVDGLGSPRHALLGEDSLGESLEMQELSYGADNMTFRPSPVHNRKPSSGRESPVNYSHRRAPLLGIIAGSQMVQEVDIYADLPSEQSTDWRWAGIMPQALRRDEKKEARARERRATLINAITKEPIRQTPELCYPGRRFPSPSATSLMTRVLLGKTPPDVEDEWEQMQSRESLLLGGRQRSASQGAPTREGILASNRRLSASPEMILRHARERRESQISPGSSGQGEDEKPISSPKSPYLLPPSPLEWQRPSRPRAASMSPAQVLSIHKCLPRRASEPAQNSWQVDAMTQTPRQFPRPRKPSDRADRSLVLVDECVQCSPLPSPSSSGTTSQSELDKYSLDVTLDIQDHVYSAKSSRSRQGYNDEYLDELPSPRMFRTGAEPSATVSNHTMDSRKSSQCSSLEPSETIKNLVPSPAWDDRLHSSSSSSQGKEPDTYPPVNTYSGGPVHSHVKPTSESCSSAGSIDLTSSNQNKHSSTQNPRVTSGIIRDICDTTEPASHVLIDVDSDTNGKPHRSPQKQSALRSDIGKKSNTLIPHSPFRYYRLVHVPRSTRGYHSGDPGSGTRKSLPSDRRSDSVSSSNGATSISSSMGSVFITTPDETTVTSPRCPPGTDMRPLQSDLAPIHRTGRTAKQQSMSPPEPAGGGVPTAGFPSLVPTGPGLRLNQWQRNQSKRSQSIRDKCYSEPLLLDFGDEDIPSPCPTSTPHVLQGAQVQPTTEQSSYSTTRHNAAHRTLPSHSRGHMEVLRFTEKGFHPNQDNELVYVFAERPRCTSTPSRRLSSGPSDL